MFLTVLNAGSPPSRCKQIAVWRRLASCLLIVPWQSWGQSDSEAQEYGGVGFKKVTQEEGGIAALRSRSHKWEINRSKPHHMGKPRGGISQQNHWPPEPRTWLPTVPDATRQVVLSLFYTSAPSATGSRMTAALCPTCLLLCLPGSFFEGWLRKSWNSCFLKTKSKENVNRKRNSPSRSKAEGGGKTFVLLLRPDWGPGGTGNGLTIGTSRVTGTLSLPCPQAEVPIPHPWTPLLPTPHPFSIKTKVFRIKEIIVYTEVIYPQKLFILSLLQPPPPPKKA